MKITVYVATNKVGSETSDEIEVPDEELDGLSEEAREARIEAEAREWLFENIEWGWTAGTATADPRFRGPGR